MDESSTFETGAPRDMQERFPPPADERVDHYLPPETEDEPLDFVSVGPGSYVCRIEDARPRFTRSGDRLWALKWVIDEGKTTGRVAAWDNLVFSTRAAPRTRRILRALGLPTEGSIRLGRSDFVGRRAVVEIQTGSFEHPATGRLVSRNEVAFDGVRPLGDADATGAARSDEEEAAAGDIPF